MSRYVQNMLGANIANVTAGLVYDSVYYSANDELLQSFGLPRGANSARLFSGYGRGEISVENNFNRELRSLPSQSSGMGGWDFNILHSLDTNRHTVYLGDGSRLQVPDSLETVTQPLNGSGGPSETNPAIPFSVAASDMTVMPDGTMYAIAPSESRIYQFWPNGRGFLRWGPTQDLGPFNPTNCGFQGDDVGLFCEPQGITSDGKGNVYVADTGNNRIRKISPTGQISTLAGDGNLGNLIGHPL